MIVYRRLNFTWLPWVRSLLEPADGGWHILCFANTMQECDDAINQDKDKSSAYEYRVEIEE